VAIFTRGILPVSQSVNNESVTFAVYDIELIRRLCAEIRAAEQNSHREHDLIALLQAVIKDDQEEVRIRLAFLTSKYAAAISDAKAAD
jgi:hypothetical protein